MNGSVPQPAGPSASRRAFAGIFAVTALGLLAVGATLPVLPRYVSGPLGAGDLTVGIVTGAFAATGLLFRPIGGAFADSRGRKPVVVVGALLTAAAGCLYFVPAGVPGLIVARLCLGAGEGMVYTAGSAWIVDMSPADRRGRIIGLYGLAIWGGLSVGPPLGELLRTHAGYDAVWALAAAAPLLGAAIATPHSRGLRARRRGRQGQLAPLPGAVADRDRVALAGPRPGGDDCRLRDACRLHRPAPRRPRDRPRRARLHGVRRDWSSSPGSSAAGSPIATAAPAAPRRRPRSRPAARC